MKKQSLVRAAVFAAVVSPLNAYATNGYQLIGVGAYQKGVAGAVTANPGSAMTAVSNPAGMARVGKRADFSMEAFMPSRHADFTGMGGMDGESAVELYGVPSIGWTAPVAEGSDFYFGGGMFGTSGMGVDYAPAKMAPGYYTDPTDPGTFVATPLYWDGYSNLSFWQMAPGVAWNVNSRYSVGVSLNIDYQSVAFKQRVLADADADGQGDTLMSNFDLSRGASSFGLGLGVGVLYDVNDKLTVGFNYKSRQGFSPLEYQLGYGDINQQAAGGAFPAGTYKLDLDFPQQAAVGVAVRPQPGLTVAFDMKWINWSDTMDTLSVDGPGAYDMPMDPGWDDQMVYALGVVYALNDSVELRAGYNYAEAPFGETEVSRNLILPAVVETHYTVGMGMQLNSDWDLSLHYMYVPENSLKAPVDDSMTPGAEISLSETSFGMNIGYRF